MEMECSSPSSVLLIPISHFPCYKIIAFLHICFSSWIGEGNGNPLQYSCLEKSHGRRSVIGYSPWGHKESDTAGRCHFQLDKELPGCGEQVHPVLTLGLTQSKLKSLTNVD